MLNKAGTALILRRFDGLADIYGVGLLVNGYALMSQTYMVLVLQPVLLLVMTIKIKRRRKRQVRR